MLVQIFCSFLLVAVVFAADQCHQTCTSDKQEICASDGKTYANSCKFGVASCYAHERNRILYEVHSGECSSLGVHGQLPACTAICDEDVNTICGTDNKLYDNKCKFRRAQCQYALKGEYLGMVSSADSKCPTPKSLNCSQYKMNVSNLAIELDGLNLIICPTSTHHAHQAYTYICASNNRSYRNECRLCYHIEYIKSRNNGQAKASNWMILHDGRCKPGIAFNPFGLTTVG